MSCLHFSVTLSRDKWCEVFPHLNKLLINSPWGWINMKPFWFMPPLSPSQTDRNLGVTLDSQLSLTANITTRSCRFMLYNIRRIRPLLTQKAVQVLVISHLDYCTSLLAGLPASASSVFHLNSLTKGSGPVHIQDTVKHYTPASSLRSASTNRLVAPLLGDCLLSWLLNVM